MNPSRLKMLHQKAAADQPPTFHWAKAKMNGKMLRVNGQHSSIVLGRIEWRLPEGLQVHIDENVVDGPNGLALLSGSSMIASRAVPRRISPGRTRT